MILSLSICDPEMDGEFVMKSAQTVVVWLDSGGAVRHAPVGQGLYAGTSLMFIHGDELYSFIDQSLYVHDDNNLYSVSRDGTRVWARTNEIHPHQIRFNGKMVDQCTYFFMQPYHAMQCIVITFEGNSWSVEVRNMDDSDFSHFDGEKFWGCISSADDKHAIICSDHSKKIAYQKQ